MCRDENHGSLNNRKMGICNKIVDFLILYEKDRKEKV